MLDKDFNWCFNHENLFRYWLECIYKRIDYYDMDNDSIHSLWQEAKKYALEIANSKDPILYRKIKDNDMITNFSNNNIFLLSDFLDTMLRSSKNKNLETFAYCGDEGFKAYLSEKKTDINSIKIDELDVESLIDLNMAMLVYGQYESDYDYSLPDGGIKETKTKTITDETITKTETEADGSVKLPDVLDTNEFKKYLSLAKENGLIKDVNGKLEWIQIGNRGGSSQLAYFLGRAFGYKHSVNGNNGNQFPGNELDELFGVNRIYRLLVQVHEAPKPQKWRRKIDELFE